MVLTSKLCIDCKVEKPLDDFQRLPLGKLGRHPRCTPCKRQYERTRYSENRGRARELHRSRARKHLYGLTTVQYDTFVVEMGSACQICGADENLALDHDHDTGEPRGLLCKRCNSGIGFFFDDAEMVSKALAYLMGEV